MDKKQREQFLNEFRKTPDCMHIREELASYMQEVESVLSISDDILKGDEYRLATETIGKRIASEYLNKLLLRLMPDEVSIPTKRIIR
jgi:hypothetical protein